MSSLVHPSVLVEEIHAVVVEEPVFLLSRHYTVMQPQNKTSENNVLSDENKSYVLFTARSQVTNIFLSNVKTFTYIVLRIYQEQDNVDYSRALEIDRYYLKGMNDLPSCIRIHLVYTVHMNFFMQ